MRKDLTRYELKIEDEKPPISKKLQDGTEEKLGCLRRHESCECPKIERETAKPVYTPLLGLGGLQVENRADFSSP